MSKPRNIIIYCMLFTMIFFTFCKGEAVSDAKPEVSAHSAILIEKNSGRVLFSKNSGERLPMASTTKIMTAICAIEAVGDGIDNTIEITAEAAGVEGSSMYLETGEKMTMRELLYGLMLSSGNDAAVAISEALSTPDRDFVSLINAKAQEIGAVNTHFTNPNGLPDENHYSTAEDMAKITAYALNNPLFAEIVASKTYKIEGEGKAYPRVLSNHNKLLNSFEGCVGVKTGFTKAAGRCLVGAAERDGMTVICVTLNAPDDWNDHRRLFEFAFESFKYTRLAAADTPIDTAEVAGAYAGAIPVYPEADIFYPMAEGEHFICETQLYPELSAPIKQGEKVGSVSFLGENGGKISVSAVSGGDVPLVVRSDIDTAEPPRGIGSVLLDSLRNFFGQWLGFFSFCANHSC